MFPNHLLSDSLGRANHLNSCTSNQSTETEREREEKLKEWKKNWLLAK